MNSSTKQLAFAHFSSLTKLSSRPCQWQATALLAQRLIAIMVGVSTIIVVRLTIVYFCKCSFFVAFFRERPAVANMTLLGLEWASFALSGGFIFLRMCKLLIAATAWIGRIDKPFLSKDVARFLGVEMDYYPQVHKQELLSHEAHRHPFIELLAAIVSSSQWGAAACFDTCIA